MLVRGALALISVGAIVWLEQRWALRTQTSESKLRRILRNSVVAGFSGAAVQVAVRPVLRPLARRVERDRLGVLQRFDLPRSIEVVLGVFLMDYAFYWWHILLHRVPILWRSHVVHHVDLDLDASTAIRFHFTEILASIPYLSVLLLLGGIGPATLATWQTAMGASVVFHHSNLRLPRPLERLLSRALVTPSLHGIHHSVVPEETDSNYSSGLALWDALHGTRRTNVPQDEITIGVPAYRTSHDVALPRIMALPFTTQRDAWKLPNGRVPTRSQSGRPATGR